MSDYKPVNCGFYDFFEHFATLREKVTITYVLGEEIKKRQGIITDLTGGRAGEYLHLKTSTEEIKLRMDYIIAINDIKAADYGEQCGIDDKN